MRNRVWLCVCVWVWVCVGMGVGVIECKTERQNECMLLSNRVSVCKTKENECLRESERARDKK